MVIKGFLKRDLREIESEDGGAGLAEGEVKRLASIFRGFGLMGVMF